LQSGHIQLFFDAPTNLIQLEKMGRVRLIGVVSDKRLPADPDVPTFIEQSLKGFTGSTWASMLAPASIASTTVVQRMSDEVNRIIRSEETRAKLEAMGTFRRHLAASLRCPYRLRSREVGDSHQKRRSHRGLRRTGALCPEKRSE